MSAGSAVSPGNVRRGSAGRGPSDGQTPLSTPGSAVATVDLGAIDDEAHRRVVAELSATTVDRGAVARVIRGIAPLLSFEEVASATDRVLARVRGLGALDPLLSDESVTEVMVNGGGHVWVERDGRLEPTDIELPTVEVLHLIERIVAPLGRRVDPVSPIVDARLPSGSRVNVIVPPLAIDGPCLTIRRFTARPIALCELAPPSLAELLEQAVATRANLVVIGGTGAGKTTVLNALAGVIDDRERIVTVEDAAELRLPGSHVVRLEARPPSLEGIGAVTIRDLVRNALRMRPDRIVVGEVRGAEALDMLQAMNTGHDGSLSTCHANSPEDALRRLETMVLLAASGLPLAAIRDQLASALDLVVQVARRPGGRRAIVAVAEVAQRLDHRDEAPLRVRLLADERGVVAPPIRGRRDRVGETVTSRPADETRAGSRPAGEAVAVSRPADETAAVGERRA